MYKSIHLDLALPFLVPDVDISYFLCQDLAFIFYRWGTFACTTEDSK